ncbi:EP300-interacting inhibitor of differentiation 2 [Bos indicus]|uniref:EP300-interacting inhibitor of differentiation 2 n=3 Tax=Bos TaxID=9903 RepID=EID2_BOVIN|nr:EP300-interacting inhibitor of differentiation 2 [Bos taurus]XP_027371634.1 EP300-interacting inhibitor of differentiation 2 [Bos indicus x Bos taurus]XP_061244243.1 EP300-interacting inhibitor of differentiation 2 [Bos javanicus]Q17QW4.1 RecName: Full=EP300-interacting inhibitor of differentiation 2; Short=EID-2; AltName: Full=CREBBP/EP300 inhibitor 2; AltName: Full=EID-1-like inhibitor of differentiation 2 [Bos taurus]AAI18144.1 EP300 interacting inhibitor of differentiation 2 [Bos taurus]
MSELPADQGVPPAGAANDNGDVRQAEVGGRRREPAPAQPVAARDRPMAAAVEGSMASPVEGPVPEAREGPMAASREGLGAAAREARMAEVARLLAEPAEEEGPEGRPRSRPGNGPGLAALPYLRLRHPLGVLGINYQQFLRHYLEHYPIAPGRIQELEGRRRRFVEACRAREAAFDAEYQRNPQRMDFDILTFSITLTASEIINPLIEELGCDKFISRE